MMTSSSPVTTRLRPPRGWVGLEIGELSRFRFLLAALATRDVKLRYKQTLLGIAWVILQPLVAAGIFSFVFGVIAGFAAPGASYFAFSFAGLLLWNAFSSMLTKSAASLVGNTQLVTKVYFPRLILPLSTIASTLLDFLISGLALFVLLVAQGHAPGWPVALLPVWLVLTLLLGLGFGLIAASLSIEYRDVQYILPLVVPFLLYASPVAYAVDRVPERFRTAYYLINPLASVIEGFRWSILGTPAPAWGFVAYAAVWCVACFFAGTVIFRLRERRIADVI